MSILLYIQVVMEKLFGLCIINDKWIEILINFVCSLCLSKVLYKRSLKTINIFLIVSSVSVVAVMLFIPCSINSDVCGFWLLGLLMLIPMIMVWLILILESLDKTIGILIEVNGRGKEIELRFYERPSRDIHDIIRQSQQVNT